MEVKMTDNHKDDILRALDDATDRILTMVGIKAEKYAKARCPVGTPESTGKKGYMGGTLRNSITYDVKENMLSVGTNVEYAPYVELGTGPYFDSPPAWLEDTAPRGSGIGGGYVRPRPYLRPAIEDHVSEYEALVENELKNA